MPVLSDGPDPWSSPEEDNFYKYATICCVLISLGGIMSGLQQGLMQLDMVTIKTLKTEASPLKRLLLDMIVPLIQRRHMLLVTLLIWNALAMEALPIFMDVLVPKYAAIVLSVTAVVLFGEIIPQAVCLKWPAEFACMFIPLVWVLLVIMVPISYPIASLLDWMLGAEHGKRWTRTGIRELVLEQQGGISRDELDVITGALELYSKNVYDVLIPIKDVHMLPFDALIDDDMLRDLQYCGHSRIPVWKKTKENIVGLLLVKNLVRIDPKTHFKVGDIPLVPVLKVNERISLFHLLRNFRTGTSHMAVVMKSERPSTPTSNDAVSLSSPAQSEINAVGIITLEDVLEEILKSEIQDETDEWIPMNLRIDNKLSHMRNLRKNLLDTLRSPRDDSVEVAVVNDDKSKLSESIGSQPGYGSLGHFETHSDTSPRSREDSFGPLLLNAKNRASNRKI